MRAIFTAHAGANGKRTRLTTNATADNRTRALIIGTGYHLSLPASIGYGRNPFTVDEGADDSVEPHNTFRIGPVRFKRTSENTVKALDPMPASWFVDLSLDLPAIDACDADENSQQFEQLELAA